MTVAFNLKQLCVWIGFWVLPCLGLSCDKSERVLLVEQTQPLFPFLLMNGVQVDIPTGSSQISIKSDTLIPAGDQQQMILTGNVKITAEGDFSFTATAPNAVLDLRENGIHLTGGVFADLTVPNFLTQGDPDGGQY